MSGGFLAPASSAYVEPARRVTLNGWATILVFLPPALILFTIFVALPMAEAGWYSFYNWDGYGRPEKFIGLKNYGYLIGNATSDGPYRPACYCSSCVACTRPAEMASSSRR